jgi:hypothetical protein
MVKGRLLLLVMLGCSRNGASTTAGDAGSTSLLPALSLPGLPDLANLKLNAASGHVESTGSTGAWQLDDGDCFSGDKDGFFGIDVTSHADKRVYVKLVKDPLKGWNLGVSIPDTCKAKGNGQECSVHYFDQQQCSTLDVGLKSYTFSGRNAAGQHQFDGNVTFDCTHGTAHVSGKLTVERCAP